jgi:hypothetical protein
MRAIHKMLCFAWDRVTSFSVVPLRLISVLGIVVSSMSFLVGAWALSIRLVTSDAIPGWASTLIPVAFLGGLQLLALGVIGEYVGKIYAETKRRPRYIVEKTILTATCPAPEHSTSLPPRLTYDC